MRSEGGLPGSWATTTLGEIRVDHSASLDPSKSPTERFELYSIPAFPSGRPEIVSGQQIGSTKQTLVPGTVIVSKINPRINRVWVVGADNALRQIGSSEWIPFFPVAGIEPRYLAYLMQQDAFRNYLASNVSGVGGSLMRVRPATLAPYCVEIAPTHEQHRIVETLESYFTRLDAAVATLERVQRNLERYRASVLRAAVEGRLVPTEAELARAEGREYEPASVLLERILDERRRRWEEAELAKMGAAGKVPKDDRWKTKYAPPSEPSRTELPSLPDGWCWTTIDQLAHLVRNGYGKKPDQTGTVRILRINAVRPLKIDFRDCRWLPGRPEDYLPDLVQSGDLLFTRYNGSPALVGVAGMVRNVDQPTAHPDKLIKVRLLGPSVLPAYLEIASNTSSSRQFIERRTRTTAGQAGVSGGDIKQVPIPLPPVAEQVRIVDEAQRFLALADSAIETLGFNSLRANRLRQSVLKWAFEGMLVDQDATDEPAAKLIERIRAERMSAAVVDQPRRATRRKNKATA